jgi:hypothetical protein
MKTLINIRSLMACAALAATMPAVVDAQARPTFYGQPVLDRTAEIDADGIDPALVSIQRLAQAGDDWQAAATKAGLVVEDGRVLVEFQGGLAPLSMMLGDDDSPVFSQEYELVFSGDSIRQRAWVTLQNLESLSRRLSIVACRLPVANSYGAIGNEAEAAMNADQVVASGRTGQGIHLAVIDLGFGGVDSSIETGVVLRVQADLELDAEVHGTAMIEAIRDMAPDATITAIRLDAELDIIGATIRAIEAGAGIIVCPLSWFGLPGEGQACEAAAMATNNGIMWINAAGNFADRRYFEGADLPVASIGGHNFVDFGGDPYQFINGMNGGAPFSIHLASEEGLQLELYRWDGMSADFVLVGQGDKDSDNQVIAHEYVEGMYYFPMIRQVVPGAVPAFRMFAVGGDLHFSSVEGSIANPAGTGNVISVGAVAVADYAGGGTPEIYSSMGGGIFRLTLDLCGPTGCTTGTYGPQGFSGTSAACANFAGLTALQLSEPAVGGAPGRVETMCPASGEVVVGNEVQLAWTSVEGQGTIMYRVEIAADARFGIMIVEETTLDTSVMFRIEGELTLYWRVTAFNEFGAAPASNVHMLQFIPANSLESGVAGDAALTTSDSTIVIANLAAGQPDEGGQDNAAGCAGSNGNSGLIVMLAAVILAAAVVRTRRKRA